jgi:hypothetical protein
MRNLSSTTPWKLLDAELRAATDRDFERAVLPLLRAFWPEMIQPPAKKHYDRSGVDLIAFKEEGIECAVQCKGVFKVEGLADDHLGLISKSIRSFRTSPLSAEEYVLLHNQDGRNRSVAAQIDAELQTLISSGKARRVRQWDRHSFLNALQDQLWSMMQERVREQSRFVLDQMQGWFNTGSAFVAAVPVIRRTLVLKRGDRPRIESRDAVQGVEVVADTLATTQARWTLLTGLFGSGKTSAALTAASRHPDQILYVAAGDLEPRQGEVGTNVLMTRILNALSIFADFPDDDRLVFERLGSAMLRKDLSANDARGVLIVDALDENRALASPEGMTQFAGALAELRCRIILTTREEHFRATFGNFDHLFEELSSKGVPREVQLLELKAWDWPQIVELAAAAAKSAPNSERLRNLLAAVERREGGGWNEEMMRHPFFLRLILELAADGVEPTSRIAEIIGKWVWSKLLRDLKASRPTPFVVRDRNAFIEAMEDLMENVAGEMTELGCSGEIQLMEVLPSTRILELASDVLKRKDLDLGSVLAVTLLIPTAIRHRGSVPIRFTHRAFQEYFLARHLRSAGADPELYPPPVQVFWAQLGDIAAE